MKPSKDAVRTHLVAPKAVSGVYACNRRKDKNEKKRDDTPVNRRHTHSPSLLRPYPHTKKQENFRHYLKNGGLAEMPRKKGKGGEQQRDQKRRVYPPFDTPYRADSMHNGNSIPNEAEKTTPPRRNVGAGCFLCGRHNACRTLHCEPITGLVCEAEERQWQLYIHDRQAR